MKLKAFVYYIAVFIISTLSDYVVELEVVIENGKIDNGNRILLLVPENMIIVKLYVLAMIIIDIPE